MKTMMITGMGRDAAAKLARGIAGDRLRIITGSDYEGVVALKTGEADYFLGICQSGAGGALALATGMLGSTNVATVSTAGNPPAPGAIEAAVQEGKVAYGFAVDHIDKVVPRVVEAILQRGT